MQTSRYLSCFPALLALFTCALPAFADTIQRIDGERIEDCTILEEGLRELVYKPARGAEARLAAEEVISVEYKRMPKPLEEAATAVSDGKFGEAEDSLEAYLAELPAEGDKRFKWAPAYAAFRLIEVRNTLGDLAGAASAADQMIKAHTDSRYLPQAYLLRAQALRQLDKHKQALEGLAAFEALIREKQLAPALELECRLAKALVDPALKGVAKRDQIQIVIDALGAQPSPALARAKAALGEAFLEEALSPGSAQSAKLFEQAAQTFHSVVAAELADDASLAAAYTGLGECDYQRGVGKERKPELVRSALKHFLRVVELYGDQSLYVPRALFMAGRCFDGLEDPTSRARAQSLYRRLASDYPGSHWAEQAKPFTR
jgi:TolA-binding protein